MPLSPSFCFAFLDGLTFVLNSSVVCMICEPASKRATLPKPALLWWNLRIQICEYNVFGFACLSALRALPGASLAESNQSDGDTFPYETRGMLGIGDDISEAFPVATADRYGSILSMEAL